MFLAADTNSAAYQMGVVFGGLVGLFILVAVPLSFIVSLIFLIMSKKKGWLFLVIPSGLLSLLLVVIFGAGVAMGLYKRYEDVAKLQSKEVVPDDRVVASSDDLVKLKLPGHWTLLTNLNEAAQLQAGNPRKEEYLMVITDSKTDFTGSLREYSDVIIGRLKDALQDLSVEGPKEVTLDGLKALEYEVAGVIEGVSVRYIFTIAESESGFHQVIVWTLKSKRDAAWPVFREVLGTVNIKGGKDT